MVKKKNNGKLGHHVYQKHLSEKLKYLQETYPSNGYFSAEKKRTLMNRETIVHLDITYTENRLTPTATFTKISSTLKYKIEEF